MSIARVPVLVRNAAPRTFVCTYAHTTSEILCVSKATQVLPAHQNI